MKQTVIVKLKEDINSSMYCKITETNFNELKKLGFNLPYNNFENYLNNPTFKNSDIFTFSPPEDAYWDPIDTAISNNLIEFAFKEKFSVETVGFMEPENFKAQIFTQYRTATSTEYIGVVNGNIPAKWDANGQCLNPSSGYNLHKEYKQCLNPSSGYNLHKEYKQRIYTKKNSPDFYPRQKFKISWTEAMSKGLEQSGWILATNDEIEQFKTI